MTVAGSSCACMLRKPHFRPSPSLCFSLLNLLYHGASYPGLYASMRNVLQLVCRRYSRNPPTPTQSYHHTKSHRWSLVQLPRNHGLLSILSSILQHLQTLQTAPLDPELAKNLEPLCEQIRNRYRRSASIFGGVLRRIWEPIARG